MKISFKNMAFTLAEVLITMAIIGVVATLALPPLISNVSNRTYATQIKNFSVQIQQLATDQMVVHKTNNLFNTDFSDTARLVNSSNFDTTKMCNDSNVGDCWGANYSTRYKLFSESTTYQPKALQASSSGNSAILKNGIVFRYYPITDNEKAVGYFIIDVNGVDGPNIGGRDLFGFFISPRGQLLDYSEITTPVSEGTRLSNCKGASGVTYTDTYCFRALVDRNWEPLE